MTDVRRALAAAALPIALLAGCGEESSEPAPTASPTETAVPSETDPTETDSSPQHPPAVAEAVKDLAQRLGVEESEIELVSQEEVTWRDGSLGCAEPGMSYTQALVDGSRILLRVDGEDYEYHSGGDRPAFLCEKPTE